MDKRGYKLQEFVAHSANVNCLRIGKKACRLLLTGGDDYKVNLWAIGKPTSLMSLCGHTTPVESLAFDSTEVLVLGGASSGTVKLWDLQEAKMVRTLAGHRSNCTSVEFHPFGEFFASGSADTDLKIWDIRKKGCIHTYKGHNRGINTIKFTPDGRWVVSGGFDNVVKIWDLTAGKLLHDLKFHDGHIRSLDFHPLEFLLASGSADRTVKFWDLETFEMIGSARAEPTGVRAMAFHPDGRTLFCGYENNMKVYSWEPLICHDSIDMGWSTLSDLTVHEGKVIGCSHYRNSVGVWIADLSRIEPYGNGSSEDCSPVDQKLDMPESYSAEKLGTGGRSTLSSRSTSPDKDIKNIYVDYEKPIKSISSRKIGSRGTSRVMSPPELKESGKLSARKRVTNPTSDKSNTNSSGRSFVVPSIVPRDGSSGKSFSSARRVSITPKPGSGEVSLKASHSRRLSNIKYELEVDDSRVVDEVAAEVREAELFVDNNSILKSVEEKSDKISSPAVPFKLQSGDDPVHSEKIKNIRAVNGDMKSVTISHGRTRSLVEKFERRGNFSSSEDETTATSTEVVAKRSKSSTMLKEDPEISGMESLSVSDVDVIEDLMQNHDVLLSSLRSRLTKLQMIRHLWERNEIKGAINALKKLPDHSVQADVISVLAERMEVINMDLFSCLLPILVGLLDSKMERHVKMSLEMVLKLVAMFGPTIRSTISAPPSVGVDLHQEERIECCKQCFGQLQQLRIVLPSLGRRGGSLAKSALELSLVLQDHST